MPRLFIILGVLAVVAVVALHPAQPSAPIAVATVAPMHRGALADKTADVVVYVAGAVVHPGLYRLRSGTRADDAVRRAGGLRADADPARVNLAERLKDGQEVFAPLLGSPTGRVTRRQSSVRTRTKKNKATPQIVDLNGASAAELATVPGIGATLAARIVEVRERDGAFASLDELLDVAGMTPARLDRAGAYLHI